MISGKLFSSVAPAEAGVYELHAAPGRPRLSPGRQFHLYLRSSIAHMREPTA